jgi:hypothetical protein
MSIQQRILKILSGHYIHMSRVTLEFWLIDLKSSTFHDVPLYKVWSLSCKWFSRYWVVSTFIYPVCPLTFDILTSKSIVVIYFSWCTIVQCLKSVNQRVLKILSGQYIHISNMTLDLWSFDLKINRVHLLLRMYQCIMFEVCEAKGSQDIERTKYSYFQC